MVLFLVALQPKLTMPKCQKNVDCFLEACRKLGVTKVNKDVFYSVKKRQVFKIQRAQLACNVGQRSVFVLWASLMLKT